MQHFASDNYAGICPEALEAFRAANGGHAPAYGDDDWTRRVSDRLRELFVEYEAEEHFEENELVTTLTQWREDIRQKHDVGRTLQEQLADAIASEEYELAAKHLDRLNELDSDLQSAADADDEAAFATALAALLDAVRALGTPLPDETITPSDLVLPDADTSLTRVRELLSDEGLIPG